MALQEISCLNNWKTCKFAGKFPNSVLLECQKVLMTDFLHEGQTITENY